MSKKQLLEKVKSSVGHKETAFDSSIENERDRSRVEGTKRLKNAKLIEITKIKPDPEQPRKDINQDRLEELANSIKEHGVLQPITVDFVGDTDGGFYKIITGERRFKAARMVNLKEMPCIVQDDVTDKNRYAQQLIENIQREDLSPIDKAIALCDYKERLGSKAVWAEVEKIVGISEQRRKQFVSLLKLPENIQKHIVAIGRKRAKNLITEKHARALLLLNSLEKKQQDLFEEIKTTKKPLTGDQAIERAKELSGKKGIHRFSVSYLTEKELLETLEAEVKELRKRLKERVT